MLIQRAKRAAGFTLLEMIVTMGIFAVLVALAVPTMRTWISNTKVRAVSDALQNGLRLSQSESLRRSRQVVFELTNNTAVPFTAVASGRYWAINTIPSMTDGTETGGAFVESGVLAAVGSNVTVTGPAAVCFNSVGRLVSNTSTATTVTGGASCTLPTVTPPVWNYDVTVSGADRPLRVQLSMGGQVHMCVLGRTLSTSNPDGCAP
jgi:type IV fimbrial biogenesis protein FimT